MIGLLAEHVSRFYLGSGRLFNYYLATPTILASTRGLNGRCEVRRGNGVAVGSDRNCSRVAACDTNDHH